MRRCRASTRPRLRRETAEAANNGRSTAAVQCMAAGLSCLTGMARGDKLNSEAIQPAHRLHCSSAPCRAERRSAIGRPTRPATTSNANRSPSPLEECFSERREPPVAAAAAPRSERDGSAQLLCGSRNKQHTRAPHAEPTSTRSYQLICTYTS